MRQRAPRSCADTVFDQISRAPMIRLSICLRLIVGRVTMTGWKALRAPSGGSEAYPGTGGNSTYSATSSSLYDGEPSGNDRRFFKVGDRRQFLNTFLVLLSGAIVGVFSRGHGRNRAAGSIVTPFSLGYPVKAGCLTAVN